MDYNGQNRYQDFIYDDRRIFSRIYVLLKFFGIIFYLSTLLTCYKPNFYIGMVFVMFLSIINNIRYEYAHFTRYGTTFSSLTEYNNWKNELWPKSKIFFHTIEISIKTAYFVKTFPPEFVNNNNLCEIGENVLKIQILGTFIVYGILMILSIFVIFMVYCVDCFSHIPAILREKKSLQFQTVVIPNQTDECCICLDTDNTLVWSILPCGHKFHNSCVSTWLHSHQTCPVCRLRINPIS